MFLHISLGELSELETIQFQNRKEFCFQMMNLNQEHFQKRKEMTNEQI
jgi:hypothetical protein